MEIPTELVERCERLDLRLYEGTEIEDIKLFKLWMMMKENGDLTRTFIPESYTPYRMMSVFQSPTTTLYALDSHGDICFLFWGTPSSHFSGDRTVLCGLWVDASMRMSKRSLQLTSLVYELVFSQYPYCLGTTWQDDLLKPHADLGYTVAGFVPELYGINDIYFVLLRKENFYKSRLYKLARYSERTGK